MRGSQVAERGQDATGVGVHAPATRRCGRQARPLPAELGLCSKIVGSKPCDSSHARRPARQVPPRSRPRLRSSGNCRTSVNYAQRRAGNVVRAMRRPQPGVPGLRRRSCRSCVWAGSFASHVELFWTLPEYAGAHGSTSRTFCPGRSVRQGRGGAVGPGPKGPHARRSSGARSRPSWMPSASEVPPLLGVERGWPRRDGSSPRLDQSGRSALVLTGTVCVLRCADLDRPRARSGGPDRATPFSATVGERSTHRRSSSSRAVASDSAATSRSAWGSGAALRASPARRSRSTAPARNAWSACRASPGMARGDARGGVFRIDVRPILPTIGVPTLSSTPAATPEFPCSSGRYLADNIPGARVARGRRQRTMHRG